MVCRQAGPPLRVRIGAITLASCAWQATPTRSACRSSVISRSPTTTASTAVKSSSMSAGASTQPRRSRSAWRRDSYQTFHSSKEIFSFRVCRCLAATWSAVATTSLMKLSMSTAEARMLARSPSDGS